MGKLIVVVGGQYGSEGKGAVVAYLSRTENTPMVIRVGGPNAGHTVYDDQGHRFPLRQVPAGVINPDARLAIGAGSEVDYEVLRAEVVELEGAGHVVWERLIIDSQATVLEQRHKEAEISLIHDIGSTGKGIGAARADRLMRRAPRVGPSDTTRVAPIALDALSTGRTVIVEGTQGYALGLHAGHYPFCTSGDCTAIDVLAQAQLSPWAGQVTGLEIYVVFRSYPIRVAGNSGPLKMETSWEALGLTPEHTTVTQKVRRVGLWDLALAREAIAANGGAAGPVRACLMMADYWYPDVAGFPTLERSSEAEIAIIELEQQLGVPIALVGTSPTSIADRRFR